MENMFTTKTVGVFGIILLCCCSSEAAKGAIELMNRTSVALAEETIFWKIVVNVPANTSHTVRCYMNKQEVWKSENIGHHYHGTKTTTFLANVTMNDWNLNSEDFYFQYMDEKVYGVVLVRDGFFLPEMGVESFVIALLALGVLLLLFSITGSVYVFKCYKDGSSVKAEKIEKRHEKKKQQTTKKKIVKEETDPSDSVYTALNTAQVSVYDVLNVDEVRSSSRDSQIQANTSTMEEGILESVYENLETL